MKANFNEPDGSPQITPPAAETDVLDREFGRTLGQISRHSAVFFAGTLFTMAAGYLVKIYVARVLGAEQLGLYALGMTLVSLTQLFGTLGLHGTAARYVAVYKAKGNWNALRGLLTRSVGIVIFLNVALAFGLIFYGGWISRNLYHAPDLAQYLRLFAALSVLGALNVFYCQVLAGFQEITKRTVITNFVGSPLVIALTVLLLALGTGMSGYLSAQIISNVAVVALLVGVAWKLTPAPARFSFSALPPLDAEVKSFTAAVFGMNVVDFLSTQADKIILGLYLNARVLGIYVLASTLSAFIPIILQSVNQIFAPVIADLHAQGRQDVLEKLFQTLTKWILGLTLPLGFVIIIFALPLMRIFGPDFEAGRPVLVIGAVGQLVNCGVGSVGYLLLMSGNQKRLMKVQFAMAGVSVLMNVALIPLLGIVGAAIAAAAVNVGQNLWNLYEVRKALRIFPYNQSYYALLIPTVITAVALTLLRSSTAAFAHPWLIILLAFVLAYALFGGLSIAYVLDADDRMIARSAWSKLRGIRKKG